MYIYIHVVCSVAIVVFFSVFNGRRLAPVDAETRTTSESAKKKKIEYTGITRSGFFAGSISRSVLPSSSS